MQRVGRVLTILVAGVAAAIVPISPSRASPGGVTSADVTFTGNGGVVLHGTVLTPSGATGRLPGMVMLEGAGNRGRGYLRGGAEAYARQGIVTLIYDKRTVGYSLLHRDYSVLADDALAGLQLLRARPDVDPARLGMWALSEGAFASPIAASRSDDVKFLITVGAVGTTPAAETAWEYNEYLRHAGVSDAVSRALRTDVLPAAIGAGLFAESSFEPAPWWRRVRQPVLAEWGELDRDSVPAESLRIIGGALDAGGNKGYKLRVVPGVNHNLHVTAADGFDRLDTLPGDYAKTEIAWIRSIVTTNGSIGTDGASPGGADTAAGSGTEPTPGATATSTVAPTATASSSAPAATSAPSSASSGASSSAASGASAAGPAPSTGPAAAAEVVGTPASNSSAEEVGAPPWYHRTWPLIVTTLLIVVGFLVAPIRRRAGRAGTVWAARSLVAMGPTAVVGTVAYLMFLLATAGKVTGPLVLGRPIPWLALELLTIGTAVVAIAAAVSWRQSDRTTRDRVRLGLSIGAAVLLVPWVASWGLLAP